jgi:hypothetical protein
LFDFVKNDPNNPPAVEEFLERAQDRIDRPGALLGVRDDDGAGAGRSADGAVIRRGAALRQAAVVDLRVDAIEQLYPEPLAHGGEEPCVRRACIPGLAT